MDNSIQILPLKPFTREDLEPFMAPYESGELYRVEKVESEALTTFTIRLERLEQPYRSDFKQDFEEEEEFQRFLGLLGQGVSFGAYQNGALVALAICEARSDKTLWIWEFHVVERLRRQGLGKALMAQVIA